MGPARRARLGGRLLFAAFAGLPGLFAYAALTAYLGVLSGAESVTRAG